MYIQQCVKGIAGSSNGVDGLSKEQAEAIVLEARGILSNWWRKHGTISPEMVANVLTESNLDRHLHDYESYGPETPFISLACGAVERDRIAKQNQAYSAVDTALMFATDNWSRPGALFYCWVPIGHSSTVPLSGVSEPVRDINIYRRWSPFQLEGEVTAKVHIPSNQIERVEWWDANYNVWQPEHTWRNADFIAPHALSNIRELF